VSTLAETPKQSKVGFPEGDNGQVGLSPISEDMDFANECIE